MQYANQYGYSDIEPYEVVNTVSDRTLEIRAMQAERDDSVVLRFVPGGFAGHCENQDAQRWRISSDRNAPVIRIRKHKDGRWYDRGGCRYRIEELPKKFYDYNF